MRQGYKEKPIFSHTLKDILNVLGFKISKLRDGQNTSPGFEDLISINDNKGKQQNGEAGKNGEDEKKNANNENQSVVGGVSTKEHEVLNDSILYQLAYLENLMQECSHETNPQNSVQKYFQGTAKGDQETQYN